MLVYNILGTAVMITLGVFAEVRLCKYDQLLHTCRNR
jgi:hypothetical protein